MQIHLHIYIFLHTCYMHTERPHFVKEVLCEVTTLRELCFENTVQNPFIRQRTTSPILLCESVLSPNRLVKKREIQSYTCQWYIKAYLIQADLIIVTHFAQKNSVVHFVGNLSLFFLVLTFKKPY